MEFRYYQMQDGIPILAFLGEKWVQNYGRDVDYLHFHNYLEIGFCYSGEGELVLGEEPVRFAGREFTIIPPNFPHTTTSDVGNISKWEYLFIDVKGFLQVAAGTPLRAEKMIQRIYSKALCLKESEYKSLSNKIIKILEIMRASDEFYLEEANGILLALLAEVARMNRSSAEENIEEKGKNHKYDLQGHRLYFHNVIWRISELVIWQKPVISVRLIFAGVYLLYAHEPSGIY